MRASDKKLFMAVLDTLKPMEKACLLLTVIGGMTVRECGQVLKIRKSAVSKAVARAKEKARRLKNV